MREGRHGVRISMMCMSVDRGFIRRIMIEYSFGRGHNSVVCSGNKIYDLRREVSPATTKLWYNAHQLAEKSMSLNLQDIALGVTSFFSWVNKARGSRTK